MSPSPQLSTRSVEQAEHTRVRERNGGVKQSTRYAVSCAEQNLTAAQRARK
jgi:hypothetical protein